MFEMIDMPETQKHIEPKKELNNYFEPMKEVIY